MHTTKKITSFRTASLVLVGALLAIFLLIFFAVFQVSISDMMHNTQAQYLSSRLEIAHNIIKMAGISTRENAQDIAFWEETAAFVSGNDPAFLARNEALISPSHNPQISMVAILDAEGNALYYEEYGFNDNKIKNTSASLQEYVQASSLRLIQNARELISSGGDPRSAGISGIVIYDDIPYQLNIEPIVTSGDTAVYGAVTAATMLTDAYFTQLIQFDGFYFGLVETYDPETEIPVDSIGITEDVTDVNGQKIVLWAIAPRSGYNSGRTTQLVSMLILLVAAVAFVALAYYIVSRYLVNPIERLSRDIHGMKAGSVLTASDYSQSDEFSTLCQSINEFVESLNESKISLDVLEHILNGLNAYLYVSDPLSGELLFINDKMREDFSIEGDPVGKPCWQLMRRSESYQCTYCPLPELLKIPGHVAVWEEADPVIGRIYRNTDTLIDWAEGRQAHLHHRVDITDLKNIENDISQRLKQQEIMSSLSREFITSRNVDQFIMETLRMTGEFVNAGRSLIIEINPETHESRLAYEWANGEQGIRPIADGFKPFVAGNPIYDNIVVQGEPYLIVNDVTGNPATAHMAREGVRTFMALPILRDDALWGIMSVAVFAHQRDWSQSDIHLFTMIANLISAIIDRQAFEEALERMSSISESSPDYVAYVDTKGNFLYLNPGTTALTGYSAEELMAGGVKILHSPELAERIFDEIFPTILSKGRYDFELPIIHKDGSTRLLAYSCFTIKSNEEGVGTIAKDITRQRQMEQDLIEAKEQAERSNHAKSDFLSRMSHEMRTPMNAIIGMTGIAKGAADIEKKDYCLDKIDEASNHLLGVINDILDMSKIEANKFELSTSEFNFEKMLQKVTNIITFRVDEKNQNLIIDLDEQIPPYVVSDEQRLAQVITNLLSNATKFTPENGTIRLSSKLISEEDNLLTIEFAVTDNGIGISPEQQSRLFRSFEQADGGIARKFGGTGLGLAISKRIVEMMGGDIRIESELGHGSSFIFRIIAPRGKRTVSHSAGLDMSGIRVLAVDDAPEVLEYFRQLSGRFGFHCDVVAEGFDACRLIDQATVPYDIAFIDWRMPVMDGIELTRRIKSNPNAPSSVIMISAAEWNEVEEAAKEAGVDRFIPKPLYASVVVDCINECLGSAEYAPEYAENEEKPAINRYEGRTMLLAEDIEINREIVLALVEETGINVITAENGAEAVEKFSQNPDEIDLIFMDIHMPEMDGYEATRRIRALEILKAKTVPIVAMTANVFREDIERCLAAGMNDHIGKPIDVDEFYHKLNEYLEGDRHA